MISRTTYDPPAPLAFDAERHEYRINRAVVPSVTQVINDMLPQWKAGDWYLQRGRAVHAAAAIVAKGLDFNYDPRISGQVEALQKFFRQLHPEVEAVEQPVFSKLYQFAGTLDLLARIGGRRMIADYKATLTPTTPIQCAAYSLCLSSPQPLFGVGIEIREDGNYRMSEIYDLRKYRGEFLALLTVYNVRKRLGLLEKKEETQ